MASAAMLAGAAAAVWSRRSVCIELHVDAVLLLEAGVNILEGSVQLTRLPRRIEMHNRVAAPCRRHWQVHQRLPLAQVALLHWAAVARA